MLSQLQWRNEWRLQSRNPLVWIALTIVAGFSLVIADGSPADPGAPAIAALLRINLFIPAFILPFLAGALAPLFYLRETDHDMAQVFGAYPVTARQWLGMRLGNFTILLVGACLLAQLGFVAVLVRAHPDQLVAMLGRTALWLAVLHLPCCLIWATGMAWLACRKASSGFLFAAAGLGWLGYLALASLIGLPLLAGSEVVFPMLRQAMLVLDPYGTTAMMTAAPDSGVLHWREADVALGRVLWLAICVLVIQRIREMPSHAKRLVTRHEPAGGVAFAHGRPSRGWPSRIGRSHVSIHASYFIHDRIFALLLAGWIALLLPEAYGGADYAEELSRVVPDSRDALNRVMWDVVPIAGALVLLYAADRICRMYPATGMHELYAATPHRPTRLVAVQAATLWGIAALFMALTGLSVAAAQLLAGSAIQLGEYARQLGYTFPIWLLLGLLFTAVHGCIRARFVANLVCLLLIALGYTSLAPDLGLEHPLWRPLFTPLSAPDHYWGFDGSLTGHTRYLQFWMPACFAVLLLATARHHRTLPFRQATLRTLPRNSGAMLAISLAMPLVGLAAWQGFMIDRELRGEGLLVTAAERAHQRAEYERGYAAWAGQPQPQVERISAQVDFHGRSGRVGLRARLRLINRTTTPITDVLIGRNRLDQGGTIVLNGASVLRRDAALGQTIYRLDRPLLPGRTIDLAFATQLSQSGVNSAALPLVLRSSFSSVPLHAILPVVGFKRELTLRDSDLRRAQGLPDRKLTPPSALASPSTGALAREQSELDAIISTDANLYAIGQGDLVRRWQAKGRSYFHYRTAGPIRSHAVVYAVPWQPQTWQAGAVRIETYSPHALAQDDPNVLAMRDTLAWLARDIAPYPGNALRLVAIPDIGPSGYANPQVIEISHRLGFRARPEAGAGFNQTYRRAAHETAHQWFGHLLGYGLPEENAFMVESLAKYAELVLIERRYGPQATQALVRFEQGHYRQARLDLDQPVLPLIDAQAAQDMYARATLAFACARTRVGDGPIIAALRRTAGHSRATQSPARSLDFVNALAASVDPDLQGPVRSLFLARTPLNVQLARLGCATR